MSICWYCCWGWSRPVAEIYLEALRRLDGYESVLDYGPAHIVWCDENWNDESIQGCLRDCDERRWFHDDLSDNEIDVIRWSLLELLKIPEDVRNCEPEEYEGVDPDSFPPTSDVVSQMAIHLACEEVRSLLKEGNS